MSEGARSGVLVVHAADEAYGADRVLLYLVLGLRALGRRIEVLLPDDLPPGWLSNRLDEAGVAVRRGPLAPARRRYLRLRGLPGYALALARARRFIRGRATAMAAGIVHVNTSALLVAAILGRPGDARLVWHVHEIVVEPRPLAWLFRRLPTLRADRVIAVSTAVRDHLLAAGGRPASVVTIRNGLPPHDPAPLPALAGAHPLVVFLGRLNRWKGHEAFIEAAARAAERQPAARFVLAGDAPPGEAWREADADERIAASGAGDRITRLGFVEDGSAVLAAADIVVAPSTWPDPFPTVILEAMRAGRPVIASSHGGAPEMIVDGETGVLVPPGDVPALAAAIDELLADPERARRLGNAARARWRSEFGVERFVQAVDDLYRELGR